MWNEDCLSAVRPKQTWVTGAVLIPPLANLVPTSCPVPCNPAPLNPLMSERHRCPNIGHQVWMTGVKDPHGRTSWYANAEKRWRTYVKTARGSIFWEYQCQGIFIFIWPLFNQESPIEIKNLFFEGVLAKRQQQITYVHSQYYTHNI